MVENFDRTKIWNVLLLLIRIWLGYRMFTASYSSVTGIIFHPAERAFFIKWFGEELHYPMPLLMAFLAKGAELSGGTFSGVRENTASIIYYLIRSCCQLRNISTTIKAVFEASIEIEPGVRMETLNANK